MERLLPSGAVGDRGALRRLFTPFRLRLLRVGFTVVGGGVAFALATLAA